MGWGRDVSVSYGNAPFAVLYSTLTFGVGKPGVWPGSRLRSSHPVNSLGLK